MPPDPKKKVRYSIHLATSAITELDGFLTDTAREKCKELSPKNPLPFESKLLYLPNDPSPPAWANLLANFFNVDGKIKSSASAAVLLFKCQKRIMACAYGYGHVLVDPDRRENDFGLLIAANALSEENVKLVEKANLGSVIRDATQAAGITNLREFNADRALSLIRKLSGHSEKAGTSLSGANSIAITSEYDPSEIVKLGNSLLSLYKSDSYKSTGFGIIDKIKPVHDIVLSDKLDAALVDNLASQDPSFELGVPEMETEPTGHITISGTKTRTQFADLNLALALEETGTITSAEELHDFIIVTHNIDDTAILKRWSVYRGLVGSLEYEKKRYALNEGKWYRIDLALINSANATFVKCSQGLDKTYPAWPIVAAGKKGTKAQFKREDLYNSEICAANTPLLLFDKKLFPVPTNPGPGVEICDIFDADQRRLIHVKRSGRRSSVISHFLNQGLNSARLLKLYPQIRLKFLERVEPLVDAAKFKEIRDSFPEGWSVEYKFADFPNSKGDYTIPFFSRVAFDEVRREVEALGFGPVIISFIRLSKPPK